MNSLLHYKTSNRLYAKLDKLTKIIPEIKDFNSYKKKINK